MAPWLQAQRFCNGMRDRRKGRTQNLYEIMGTSTRESKSQGRTAIALLVVQTALSIVLTDHSVGCDGDCPWSLGLFLFSLAIGFPKICVDAIYQGPEGRLKGRDVLFIDGRPGALVLNPFLLPHPQLPSPGRHSQAWETERVSLPPGCRNHKFQTRSEL